MILIKKNSVNLVLLTLLEKTTIDPVFYLFEFWKEGSPGTRKTFLSNDSSTNTGRYNEFYIEENTTEDTLNGIISLETGDWFYNVYEQSSSTNLIVASSGGLVENGRVQVKEDKAPLIAFNEQQKVILGFRE